jgi:hypothetical protein
MLTAAQKPDSETSSPVAADSCVLLDFVLAEPTILDQRRFWANRAGQSVADLAVSQSVSVEEIERSLLLVRTDNERYSAAATGQAARRLFFNALPKIASALDSALSATKFQGKKVVMIDKATGEKEILEEEVERPDHSVRLQAIDTSRFILAVVQPRDPAVQIVSNSQTNILNQAPQGGRGEGVAGLTSPEAVIRAIQAERSARTLTDGKQVGQPTTIEAVKEDVVMPRVRTGDLEDDELVDDEYEDADEDEDEDEDEEDKG